MGVVCPVSPQNISGVILQVGDSVALVTLKQDKPTSIVKKKKIPKAQQIKKYVFAKY